MTSRWRMQEDLLILKVTDSGVQDDVSHVRVRIFNRGKTAERKHHTPECCVTVTTMPRVSALIARESSRCARLRTVGTGASDQNIQLDGFAQTFVGWAGGGGLTLTTSDDTVRL